MSKYKMSRRPRATDSQKVFGSQAWVNKRVSNLDSTLHKKFEQPLERDARTKVKALFDAYKGECQSCGEDCEIPNIDHCHKTGKIRGLLCRNCNTGLGQFGDDEVKMCLALQYLRKHKKTF